MSTNKTVPILKGDTVSWQSQAQGTWKKKTGTVVEVVEPGHRPSTLLVNAGGPRKAVSFVVGVPTGKQQKLKFYWPVVTALKRVAV